MKFDVAIVGSGLSGLTVALHLARDKQVVIISKKALLDGASNWAQGGIAAVLDSHDSHAQHIADTLTAGAGLCDEAATRHIVENGKPAIDWLIEQGVPFTPDASAELGFHLTREGGHSQRRIIHAADATGHVVQTTLEQKIRAHKNITLLENHSAVELITSRIFRGKIDPAAEDGTAGDSLAEPAQCLGLYVFDEISGGVKTILASHTVLATGGAGKVYLHTSNPDTATGDGMAMAWRAGCRVSNMEFMQFHPTCLYHPAAKSFLISEALRGEGGILKIPLDASADPGLRFMQHHDERMELAPRDVVARAIDFEIKKRGLTHVDLDISHCSPAFIEEHFPTIQARCLSYGIDIARQPIPVVPAMHFTCGGVVTDLEGRTDIPGLYAVGETACTGLHGANRLASNSLLECLVIGRNAARHIECQEVRVEPGLRESIPDWDDSQVTDPDQAVVVSHAWDELRRLMWDYAGIVRTDKRLARARHRIGLLRDEIEAYYRVYRVDGNMLECRNLVQVAALVVESALLRKESRGLHFSQDYPYSLPKALPTVLTPGVR
ncbi:L-aspartate oxidase [Paralcaligenes sp. KSB-10]|uniref:L-aspartate oxidase n=1 Tax=Paralcaligenes sp. KSB-10 TaxID=2901142 RepID=UPI001E3ADA46|nr:L-aspartate oxidase [Paralcaligenes sp. KSB-10]UHL66442.1 L-aspartate oxidase [Paralcaligenes sp. KSB-10]